MALPLPALGLLTNTDSVLGGKGWVCHVDFPWNGVRSYQRSDITEKPAWVKSWPQEGKGGKGSAVGSKGAGISPIVLQLIKWLK